MRVVVVGGGPLSVFVVRQMLENGHEVVVIEKDEAKIEALSDDLDCGFIHGDGSRPSVLKEASPENSDFLMCLTDSDQDNIITALVGRKQGFERIVVQISDADFEPICTELELSETINPDREGGRALSDLVQGEQDVELLTVAREGVRFLAITITEDAAGPLADLELPEGVRPSVLTCGDKSTPVTPDTKLRADDELLFAVADEKLEQVREFFREKGMHVPEQRRQ